MYAQISGSNAGIGGLGELVRLVRPLKREIDFDFDLDSSVRGGRGEAVCACETCLLNAGADLGKFSPVRVGFSSKISCYACGF